MTGVSDTPVTLTAAHGLRSRAMGTVDVVSSWVASTARLGLGLHALGHAREPEQLVELYEMENCPYSRKVRDAFTALDISARIYPCPKKGTRYRPRVKELGGKTQLPFLVDPNTGVAMYESSDIVDYLFETYGSCEPPRGMKVTATSIATSALRPLRGYRARPSRPAAQPLELYAFEASPFARLVRERLCELELSYVLHSVGKGGRIDWLLPPLRARFAADAPQTTARRAAFVARSGKMQVPYLVDPNTGMAMFESADIVRYLDRTYGVTA